MSWLWSLFTTTTGTLMWIGTIMALLYFAPTFAPILGKLSEPVAEWVGKTAPEVLQGLWDGIKGLGSIGIKTAIILALLGGGLYIGGKSKCDCKAYAQAEITKLRKDFRFEPRKKPKTSTGGFFNVF